jgi:transposase-like protein
LTKAKKEKTMIIVRTTPKYSDRFKRQVINEIQSGSISIEGARRKYGIGGSMTIPRWKEKIVNYEKEEIIEKEMVDESVIKELEAKNSALKKELMEKETELLIYKTLVEISEEMKNPEIKKKIEQELSRRLAKKKENQMGRDIELENSASTTE